MMKLPFISPLHWANGCLKDSPAVAHLILTLTMQGGCDNPHLQMVTRTFRERPWLAHGHAVTNSGARVYSHLWLQSPHLGSLPEPNPSGSEKVHMTTPTR